MRSGSKTLWLPSVTSPALPAGNNFLQGIELIYKEQQKHLLSAQANHYQDQYSRMVWFWLSF
jgi:hypothetical protein